MYRATTLGTTLAEVLEQYVEEGHITHELSMKVLLLFSRGKRVRETEKGRREKEREETLFQVLATFDKNINHALRDLTKHKVRRFFVCF